MRNCVCGGTKLAVLNERQHDRRPDGAAGDTDSNRNDRRIVLREIVTLDPIQRPPVVQPHLRCHTRDHHAHFHRDPTDSGAHTSDRSTRRMTGGHFDVVVGVLWTIPQQVVIGRARVEGVESEAAQFAMEAALDRVGDRLFGAILITVGNLQDSDPIARVWRDRDRERRNRHCTGDENDEPFHRHSLMFKRIFGIVLVITVAYAAYVWITFPNVARLKDGWPQTTAFMEQRKGELRAEGKDDALQYQPVPYARISPYLRRAVLVAEDNDFYEHGGIDVEAVKKAIRRDWERKKLTQGGSTITQQLAKNLYLNQSRNPLRKVEEYFIARSLENHLTKKRILELYLNVVEMGERVYGAEAAARYDFHVSASALTPSQAALLAGCLPNPRLMNPGAPNKRLRARQRMILARMRRWGYLFEEETLAPKKTAPPPPELEQTPPTDTATPAPTQATTSTETTETSGTTETTEPQSPPATTTT